MNEYFPPSERLLAVTDSQKSDETAAEVTEVQASPETVDGAQTVEAAEPVQATQPDEAAEPEDAAQPDTAQPDATQESRRSRRPRQEDAAAGRGPRRTPQPQRGQARGRSPPRLTAPEERSRRRASRRAGPHRVRRRHPGPRRRPPPLPPGPRQARLPQRLRCTGTAATSLAEAARWGRVEGDGHVFLTIDGEEHPVGQYPDVSNDEALAYFARKYDDIVAQVVLLEQRVASKAPTTDMQKTVTHLREQLAERNMVGDIRSAESRLDTLSTQITELEKAEKAQHDAVRAAELAAREAIVAEAEAISGTDPAQVQWKTSSARMNELFESWKTAQKSGVRLGRSNEDALWKRFRAARTVFDRHRRAYFSQLDSNNSAAKSAKEKLIAEAEALSTSTDWGFAAGEYRRLMDEWKASPRASRKDDDALWARFRAAQDVFFSSRQAANDEIDQEYAANLAVKEALLEEASGIVPVKDLGAAKKALQSIHDRWEEAGKVPRADMGRIEAGLRRIEDAVRQAEDEKWQRSNPETKARTNSALSQLESAIAGLKDDLAEAEKKGDQRKIKAAREALEARQAWLDQIQRSASELS